MHFDAEANLHIFDSQLDHIVVVGPDGSLVRTVGGRGDGRERYRERVAAPLASPRTSVPLQTEREGVEELTFADEVPVLSGIKVDWEDRIWVERRGPTGEDDGPTDIVTPAGDYTGTLPPEGMRTPDAFGPGGLMAYIERDDLDVPSVRVIRLLALEPQG